MAKKKEEAVTANVEEVKEEKTEETLEVTKEEKAAIEVQKKAAKGEKTNDKYKLKDPNTSYSEKDFTLSGDQKKELPDNPSPELVARIRSGFIEKA